MIWVLRIRYWLRAWRLRLRFLFRKDAVEREMDEELHFHLEMETRKNLGSGMLPASARRRAYLSFGGMERVKEQVRDARSVRPLEDLAQDLRFAFRQLRRSPLFTGMAVLTLALGIGANTAVFSVLNGLLLRDRPYRSPEELLHVYTSIEGESPYGTSFARDLGDLRELDDVFQNVGAFRGTAARVQDPGGVRMALVEAVTSNLFPLLGLETVLGRAISPEEDGGDGAHPVAILGYTLWQSTYGADPDILGRTIHLAGRPFTVIGVAPRGLESFTAQGFRTDFFVPMAMAGVFEGEMDRERSVAERGAEGMKVIARLRPGVGVDQARIRVDGLSRALKETYPGLYERRSFLLYPSRDVAIQPDLDAYFRAAGVLLMIAVGLVLLLACTNLASFLLARGVDRRREIALRLALGAGRGRLVRQLLVETLGLGFLGAVAGVLMARWCLDLVAAARPTMALPLAIDTRMDGTVLLFSLSVATLAGVLAGLAPALRSTKPEVAPTLKGGSEWLAQPGVTLRNLLVGFQVAVSVVLLLAGGLLIRDALRVQGVDPGFDTGDAALAWIDLEVSGVPPEEWASVTDAISARARALPGVRSVAVSNGLPLSESTWEIEVVVPGVVPPPGQDRLRARFYGVGPNYLGVMGVPVLEGRGISRQDRSGSERVVVVSEAAAHRYWPGRSPLGALLRAGPEQESFRVVGVARDTKVLRIGEAPQPLLYFARAQLSTRAGQLWLVVRGSRPAAELLGDLRALIREQRADLVVVEAKSMEEHLSLALFLPRLAALVVGVFGFLALALAAVGLYGLTGYSVSRRAREVGIRISLGATRGELVRMLVTEALGVVLVGGAVGLLVGAGVARFLTPFLADIGPADPVAFALVPTLLLLVAGLAAWLPARRAGRADPAATLRSD